MNIQDLNTIYHEQKQQNVQENYQLKQQGWQGNNKVQVDQENNLTNEEMDMTIKRGDKQLLDKHKNLQQEQEFQHSKIQKFILQKDFLQYLLALNLDKVFIKQQQLPFEEQQYNYYDDSENTSYQVDSFEEIHEINERESSNLQDKSQKMNGLKQDLLNNLQFINQVTHFEKDNGTEKSKNQQNSQNIIQKVQELQVSNSVKNYSQFEQQFNGISEQQEIYEEEKIHQNFIEWNKFIKDEKRTQQKLIKQQLSIKSELGQIKIDFLQEQLNKNNYSLDEYLTKGGEAYIFIDSTKKTVLRIQEINNEKGNKDYQNVKEEYEVIFSMKNKKNIIDYQDMIVLHKNKYTSFIVFIMEQCQFSLLYELSQCYFGLFDLLKITFNILDGLIELRLYSIYHSDIKPSNILKSYQGSYVISDFGASQIIGQDKFVRIKAATEGYIPKRINTPYFHDIYAVGKTLKTTIQRCIYSQNELLISKLKLQIDLLTNEDKQNTLNCLEFPQQFIDLILKSEDKQVIEFLEYYLTEIKKIISNKTKKNDFINIPLKLESQYNYLVLQKKIMVQLNNKNHFEIFSSEYQIGKVLFQQKKYQESFVVFYQLINKIFDEKINDEKQKNIIIKSLRKIGYILAKQENLSESLQIQEKLLDIAEKYDLNKIILKQYSIICLCKLQTKTDFLEEYNIFNGEVNILDLNEKNKMKSELLFRMILIILKTKQFELYQNNSFKNLLNKYQSENQKILKQLVIFYYKLLKSIFKNLQKYLKLDQIFSLIKKNDNYHLLERTIGTLNQYISQQEQKQMQNKLNNNDDIDKYYYQLGISQVYNQQFDEGLQNLQKFLEIQKLQIKSKTNRNSSKKIEKIEFILEQLILYQIQNEESIYLIYNVSFTLKLSDIKNRIENLIEILKCWFSYQSLKEIRSNQIEKRTKYMTKFQQQQYNEQLLLLESQLYKKVIQKMYLLQLGIVLKENKQLTLIEELMKNFTNLRYLTISLQVNNHSKYAIIKLAKGIESLQNLEILGLKICEYSFLSENDATELGNSLSYLINLQNLVLIISKYNVIGNNGITKLTQKIKELVNLKLLEIIIEDENIISINETINSFKGELKNLISLNISIGKLYNVDVLEIKEFGNWISNLKYLTNLNISIDQNIEFIPLGQSLQNLANLSNLSIELVLPNIKALGLIKELSHLQQIQSLFLSIGDNIHLGPQEILELGQMIVNLQKLTIFSLIIKQNRIGFEGAHDLANEIEKWKHLTNLSITIDENNILTNGAKRIGKAISYLFNLICLEINIGKNNIMSNGAEQLIQEIAKLDKLKELTLQIGDNNNIGIKGAMELGNYLAQIHNLQKLELIIEQNNISQSGAIGLAQGLSKLQNLDQLFLYIANNNNIGKGGVDEFKNLNKIKKKLLLIEDIGVCDLELNQIKQEFYKQKKQQETTFQDQMKTFQEQKQIQQNVDAIFSQEFNLEQKNDQKKNIQSNNQFQIHSIFPFQIGQKEKLQIYENSRNQIDKQEMQQIDELFNSNKYSDHYIGNRGEQQNQDVKLEIAKTENKNQEKFKQILKENQNPNFLEQILIFFFYPHICKDQISK